VIHNVSKPKNRWGQTRKSGLDAVPPFYKNTDDIYIFQAYNDNIHLFIFSFCLLILALFFSLYIFISLSRMFFSYIS
jgi:hypothetical protein